MPKKQKVLIVDDEANIANTLSAIFSMHGYETRAAYSAEEAIGIVARWEPELAIIDVVLPEMNGIDLAILLRASNPSIQALMISGQLIADQLMIEAVERGHEFRILAKPTPVPELLSSAASLLNTPPGASSRLTDNLGESVRRNVTVGR